mgnify:CR=1 FL=1
MNKETKPFSYSVSEGAFVKIAETAMLSIDGIADTKKQRIVVHCDEGCVTVNIHIHAYYGVQLQKLALTIQQHVVQAICAMAEPKKLSVHVTIEDLLIESNCKAVIGG